MNKAMVILHQGERANLVCNMEEIKSGNPTIYAMFKNRLYDTINWKNIDGEDVLYGYVRSDLKDAIPAAEKELESLFKLPEVIQMALVKGLGVDDINIIGKEFDNKGMSHNKYVKALCELAKAG